MSPPAAVRPDQTGAVPTLTGISDNTHLSAKSTREMRGAGAGAGSRGLDCHHNQSDGAQIQIQTLYTSTLKMINNSSH